MVAAAPSTEHDMSPEHREILKKVRECKEASDAVRKPYLPRWREWYGLHRNYRKFRSDVTSANTESDRDEAVREGQREFGAELFIPYIFTVVETVSPRVLMNDPRMKVKPKRGLDPDAADAIKEMFEERQAEIDYSLRLQPLARQGLKYGLGVGKTFWEVKGRNVPVLERMQGVRRLAARLAGQSEPPATEYVITSQGPCFEDVELEDFFWDPAAKNIATSRYAIHRTWRDMRYIRERVEREEWLPIDLEAVESMGSNNSDRSQMLSERANAAGLEGYDSSKGAKLHEVWEYHDGEQVHTILDGKLVVQDKPSPFRHCELPFQIYRPTLQEGEFVGIGEIEPIVHLQYELNTMRSQRRDNASLVLQKAFIYAEGMVDPADLVIGPGKGIPVYGNPGEVIQALNFGDIPASGYQEEAAIKSDIELASGGMSDTGAGGSGAGNASAETATGIQLVQAAANVRVEMKTKNLHAETIKPAAGQWLELWRQNIGEEPHTVTVEGSSGWEFKEVSAEDLDKVRAMVPEEDSTGPINPAQERNDALALHNQTNGSEVIDPRKSMQHLLRAFDVPNAEEWILPEQVLANPQVAQQIGMVLQQTLMAEGMEEEQANQLALATMQMALQQTGVSEPPQAAAEASQNGNGAVPQEA